MGFLFFVLLIIFFVVFWYLDPTMDSDLIFSIAIPRLPLPPLEVNINETLEAYRITQTQARGALAVGIIFCEFAIIAFWLADAVGGTIRDVLKPLLRLATLSAFLLSVYRAFGPIVDSLFNVNAEPTTITDVGNLTNLVDDYVVMTIVLMILFLIVNAVLGQRPEVDREIKRLQAENARLKSKLLG